MDRELIVALREMSAQLGTLLPLLHTFLSRPAPDGMLLDDPESSPSIVAKASLADPLCQSALSHTSAAPSTLARAPAQTRDVGVSVDICGRCGVVEWATDQDVNEEPHAAAPHATAGDAVVGVGPGHRQQQRAAVEKTTNAHVAIDSEDSRDVLPGREEGDEDEDHRLMSPRSRHRKQQQSPPPSPHGSVGSNPVHRDENPYHPGNTFSQYLGWMHLLEMERLARQPCRRASPDDDAVDAGAGHGGADCGGRDAGADADAQEQEQASQGLGYHAGETMHLFSCPPESGSDIEADPGKAGGGDDAAFCESPSLLPPVATRRRYTAIAQRLFPELQAGVADNLDKGPSTTDRASGRQMKRAGDGDGGGRGAPQNKQHKF